MRLVQMSVPPGEQEAVLSVLDAEGIDYVVTDETGGGEYVAVIYFPLPINAVEPVLKSLRESGVDEEAYTVIVDAETVISRKFEALEERYETDEEEGGNSETRIAGEELVTRAEELAPTFSTYVTLTVISAVVATAGLLIDSPATIVGSMVIAPLIGPAMSASVGTVVNDREMFERGVKLQAIGLLIAVASSAVFAFLAHELYLVPPTLNVTRLGEVGERLTPGILTLVVAIGAGFAGAISLSAGVSVAIVGVMIAVALIPPAAVVGIGIAWGLPLVSIGAGILTLVNTLSINLSAITLLWYRGYHPEHVLLRHAAWSATFKRVAVLVVVIAILSLFLVGITYDSFKRSASEQDIKEGVADVVEGHESLVLLETTVSRDRGSLFRPPGRVVVTVGAPPGVEPPPIGAEIDRRVDRITGGNASVQVRYVTVEMVDGENRSSRLRPRPVGPADRPAPSGRPSDRRSVADSRRPIDGQTRV